MKKLIKTAGVLGLMSFTVMSNAYSAEDNDFWYIGGNIGQSRAKIDVNSISSALKGAGFNSSINEDDKGDAYKLLGGYQFNKNFAVEGGYFNLGDFGYTATTVPAGSLNGKIKLQGLNIDAVGILPFDNKFSLFGRLGLQYAQAQDAFSSTGAVPTPTNPNAKKDALNYKAGLGLQYDFNKSLGMRIEAERYRINDAIGNDGDINAYSLGLVYRFGKAAVKEAKDTTAPFVTLVSPYNSTVGVPIYRQIRVAFSEPMDNSTVNDKTVILQQGTTLIAGKVVSPTDTTVNFTGTSNLAADTLYTARVTTGVKDVAGNAMQKDYVWIFKTAPTPDPKVTTKVVVISKFVMLEDTHFKLDSTSLSSAGEDILDQNAKIMKDNPDLKVRIAGYASASGTKEYNQELSERRAAAVVDYMVNKGGVAPERFDTIGYGETRPAMYEDKPSDTRSDAAKANMRVLFEVIAK